MAGAGSATTDKSYAAGVTELTAAALAFEHEWSAVAACHGADSNGFWIAILERQTTVAALDTQAR